MLLINHSTSSAISIEGESGENHIIMFYYYKNIELNFYFKIAVPLISIVNQSAWSTLAWVLICQSDFDWVLNEHHW